MHVKHCKFPCVYLCTVYKAETEKAHVNVRSVCLVERQSALLCRVLILQGCAVTCRLINSVLSVVRLLPTASTAMIKRDALKGRKPFQFTPDTSWMSSIHLDRNGHSFSSPVSLCDWVLLKYAHTFLRLYVSFPSSVCRVFLSLVFSFPANTRSLPSPLTSLSPFLSAEASHQS